VIDMQNCFVENSPFAAPAGKEVLDRINGVVAQYREQGSLIVFARHVVRKDHSNIGLLGDVLPPVKGGVIDEDRASAALHSKLDVRAGDIVLAKPRFSAFLSTDLELILRSKAIDTVVIGGIATNVCCDTTAREASMRDFKVLFLRDGTATFDFPDVAGMGVVSAEEMQRAICTTLAFAFGEVLSCDEAIAKLAANQQMKKAVNG
jgi:ureidoacrylate peracid hydrolase